MNLENELLVFLLIPYLDKNGAKALSLTSSRLLELVNKNIKNQLILFRAKGNPFTGKPRPQALKKLLLTRNLNPGDLEVYSWGSYMKSGGILAMLAPRDEIVYGKWNKDYFYVRFEVIDYDENNSYLPYEQRRMKMNIFKLLFSKNLILLPFHKYSSGENITDWLA